MRGLIILYLIFMVKASWAQNSQKSALRFEPIYGVEHVETRYPAPARMVTRAVLGGRVLYGVPSLSAELELSQSRGKRSYPSQNIAAEDQITRLMMGLRSSFALAQSLSWYLRGGLRASKEKTTLEENGVKTVKEPAVGLDPYAGSGLQLSLASLVSLNAGATLIFSNNSTGQKYDVQYTLGFSFHFGSM
jgi:hypothetical protein